MSIEYNGVPTVVNQIGDNLLVEDDQGTEYNINVIVSETVKITLIVQGEVGGSAYLKDNTTGNVYEPTTSRFEVHVPLRGAVTFYATPSSGYAVEGWYIGSVTDPAVSVSPSYTTTISSDTNVYIKFKTSSTGYQVQYFGSPTQVTDENNPYVLDAEDSIGGQVTVLVHVREGITPVNASCYLTRFDKDGSSTTLTLPIVSSIEDAITSSLTEVSTIIYGFDDNFVMDLGVVQRLTVNIQRVQPKDASRATDDEDYSHADKWTNGHWFEMLLKLVDGWQNLNWGFVKTDYEYEFRRTGGFTFHYEPPVTDRDGAIYGDLYPVIDKNVFISGSISTVYSNSEIQKISVSLPLAVSSMVQRPQVNAGRDITFIPQLMGASNVTQTFPVDIPGIAPDVPDQWVAISMEKRFSNWSNRIDSTTWMSGDFIDPMYTELYAEWALPIGQPYIATLDNNDIEVSAPSDARYIRMWIVGGGGSGGGGSWTTSAIFFATPGGGSSGAYRQESKRFEGNVEKIILHAGRGGVSTKGALSSQRNGEDSYVRYVFSDGATKDYTARGGNFGGNVLGRSSTSRGDVPGAGGAAVAPRGVKGENGYASDTRIIPPVTTPGGVIFDSEHEVPITSELVLNEDYGSGGDGQLNSDETGPMFYKGKDGMPGIVIVMFYDR